MMSRGFAASRSRMAVRILACALGLTVPAAVRAGGADSGAIGDGPWHDVSVTDTQGWTLRGVSLSLSEDGRELVIVRADGAQKRLAFAEVALVETVDGRDITDEVLTGVPAAETATPAARAADPRANPEFDAAPRDQAPGRGHRRGAAPLVGFSREAGGGVADVAGDWFWGLEDGTFTQFGARLGQSRNAYLHLLYRHQQAGSRSYYTWDGATGTVDFTIQSFQLMFGRHTPEKTTRTVRSLAYLETGGGVMRLRASGHDGVVSASRFALAAQAGLWLRVSGDLALDVALHGFYKPGWIDDDETGGTSLGLQLCLMYLGR